jgi:large subunit ribosomal protein L9
VAEAKDAEEKQQAEAVAERLNQVEIEIARRVGDHDTLYGSVTTSDIAHALEAKGFTIEKRRIVLAEPLKALGDFTVPVRVHRDIPQAQVRLKIVADKA